MVGEVQQDEVGPDFLDALKEAAVGPASSQPLQPQRRGVAGDGAVGELDDQVAGAGRRHRQLAADGEQRQSDA